MTTKQKYILKIDNPCGQDWTEMIQNDIGKFCSHCSKTVVDFTNLTDIEVIKLIEQTNGKLCGRLTHQQINRILDTNQPSSSSRLYRILAGLILVGVTENSPANKLTLPTEISSIHETEILSEQPIKIKEESITDSMKNVVQGIVIDSVSKEPLIDANIIIEDTKTVVVTDVNGEFIFAIPDSLMSDNITLVVTYIGYEKKKIIVKRTNLPMTKELLLIHSKQAYLGDVTIIKKKKWWQRKRK